MRAVAGLQSEAAFQEQSAFRTGVARLPSSVPARPGRATPPAPKKVLASVVKRSAGASSETRNVGGGLRSSKEASGVGSAIGGEEGVRVRRQTGLHALPDSSSSLGSRPRNSCGARAGPALPLTPESDA